MNIRLWGSRVVSSALKSRFMTPLRIVALVAAVAACLGAAAPTRAASASTGSRTQAVGAADSSLALLAVQQAQLTAPDGATNDYFGYSVAISGGTAVVGAPFHPGGPTKGEGSAYVFTRSGATWTQQAQLTAGDRAAGDSFGASVAISGDTVVVGACGNSTSGMNPTEGSAYVFTRSGTTWSQQQELLDGEEATPDYFGLWVAISGDTIVVGAPDHNVGANVDQGSAYVFTRSGTTWNEQQELTAADGVAGDQFARVAISGDTIVVGVPGHYSYGNWRQGGAYVFTLSGSTWSQQQKLTAADGDDPWDCFGASVAISGDTVLVGAPQQASTGNSGDGQSSAYVFTRVGIVWIQQQKLTAADWGAWDSFGEAVAISGDTIVVGAPDHNVGANLDQGSAYVFTRSGTTWNEQQELTAADSAAPALDGDRFGSSAAISGATIVAGACADTVGGNIAQGSAYVYQDTGSPGAPYEPPPSAVTTPVPPTIVLIGGLWSNYGTDGKPKAKPAARRGTASTSTSTIFRATTPLSCLRCNLVRSPRPSWIRRATSAKTSLAWTTGLPMSSSWPRARTSFSLVTRWAALSRAASLRWAPAQGARSTSTASTRSTRRTWARPWGSLRRHWVRATRSRSSPRPARTSRTSTRPSARRWSPRGESNPTSSQTRPARRSCGILLFPEAWQDVFDADAAFFLSAPNDGLVSTTSAAYLPDAVYSPDGHDDASLLFPVGNDYGTLLVHALHGNRHPWPVTLDGCGRPPIACRPRRARRRGMRSSLTSPLSSPQSRAPARSPQTTHPWARRR